RHDTPGGYRRQGCPVTVDSEPTGYTPDRMDPLDHLLALPDGLRCTVCDERVPATRIRLLAWRDDLAFLQIDCQGCASTTLGFVLGGRSEEAAREAGAPRRPRPGRPRAKPPQTRSARTTSWTCTSSSRRGVATWRRSSPRATP